MVNSFTQRGDLFYKTRMKRRFYIDKKQIQNGMAKITGQEARHLIKVNRVSSGDKVTLVDGQGHAYSTRIMQISQEEVIANILNTAIVQEMPFAHITLAQGMLKDKKMDGIVRHMTELGIHRWIPFFAERSVPRPNQKRLASRMDRWERIAQEALKQCGSTTLPELSSPLPFQEVMEISTSYDVKISFYEKATRPLNNLKAVTESPKKIIILIGPEGGFSHEEMTLAAENGFSLYTMGPRILRAETAALAACSLIQYIFGDLGKNKS